MTAAAAAIDRKSIRFTSEHAYKPRHCTVVGYPAKLRRLSNADGFSFTASAADCVEASYV